MVMAWNPLVLCHPKVTLTYHLLSKRCLVQMYQVPKVKSLHVAGLISQNDSYFRRLRWLGSSSFLRRRRFFGVTSSSSSFSIKSRHCSRLKMVGGVSWTTPSDEDDRMLV